MQDIPPRYMVRIQPVLDHVRASLDQPLRLDALARMAGLSGFHFHRVFKAVMGETLNAHVRRLRMERGYFLLNSFRRTRVIDVAVACGYSSQSAFTRDFKRHFGTTPGRILRTGNARCRTQDRKAREPGAGDPLAVSIETLPDMHVLSETRFGPYDFRLGLAWIRLILKAKHTGLMTTQSRKIGVVHDDPDVTPRNKCRFDVAVSVRNGPGTRNLPAQRCAMLEHSGGFSRLGQTIDRLYGEWLVNSGYYPAEQPLLMFFPRHLHEYNRFRICLPVTPIAGV